MTREEYLRRPLIDGITYKIEKEEIRIWDDSTLFIHIHNCEKITLKDVQANFHRLRHEAKASGKVKLKGSTKFFPAVRQLYPAYCAACEEIERLYNELSELVRQIERDGIHMGWSDDELMEAAIRKQGEINRHYYRNSVYSRFHDYNNRVCTELRDKLWEDEEFESYTIQIA